MKTSTLLLLGAGVGALVLLAKARKAGMGDDDMLVPPPGRTITSSGQVLGGLGLETRFIDSYDANPSQYRRQVINDLIPGMGAFMSSKNTNSGRSGSGKGWFSGIASKWGKDQADAAAKEKAKLAAEQQKLDIEAIAQRKVNETLAAIQKQAEADMLAQQKAEEERQAAANQKSAEEAKRWQEQAILAAAAKPWQNTPGPAPPASNYDQAKQAYDAVQAAREQASMSQTSNDTGYGRTSDDSGYGSTQQVTEEGAPKLPERIAQVQTPSAQMLPQEAAPAPAGNSKVGLIVGGGVLAAIAAALAS